MAYHIIPQPEEISKREKEDGMGAYLMMFAGIAAGLPLPILNLLASVIYYYVNKDKSRFVKFHSLQSLWSQLPTTLMNAVLLFWTLQIFFFESFELTDVYWGYLMAVVIANLLYFIFSIVGAAKARKGKMYYFIFFGKLAYHQAFLVREERETEEVINKPPM
jgi:uncharacterized membrane protein